MRRQGQHIGARHNPLIASTCLERGGATNGSVRGGIRYRGASMRIPRSVEFYEHLAATISARLKENARETRTTLGDLVGGAIRLMSNEAVRDTTRWDRPAPSE